MDDDLDSLRRLPRGAQDDQDVIAGPVARPGDTLEQGRKRRLLAGCAPAGAAPAAACDGDRRVVRQSPSVNPPQTRMRAVPGPVRDDPHLERPPPVGPGQYYRDRRTAGYGHRARVAPGGARWVGGRDRAADLVARVGLGDRVGRRGRSDNRAAVVLPGIGEGGGVVRPAPLRAGQGRATLVAPLMLGGPVDCGTQNSSAVCGAPRSRAVEAEVVAAEHVELSKGPWAEVGCLAGEGNAGGDAYPG